MLGVIRGQVNVSVTWAGMESNVPDPARSTRTEQAVEMSVHVRTTLNVCQTTEAAFVLKVNVVVLYLTSQLFAVLWQVN